MTATTVWTCRKCGQPNHHPAAMCWWCFTVRAELHLLKGENLPAGHTLAATGNQIERNADSNNAAKAAGGTR